MKFISATYHTNIKVAEFVTNDGRRCLRSGGTLPWRINNCGDLSSPVNSKGEPNPKLTKNYIGFAKVPSKNNTDIYHFFIFPDYETGRKELKTSLKRKYAAKNIPAVIEKYAPPHDNDTQGYIHKILKETKLTDDKKIEDLTDAELENLINAIQKIEGYHNEENTRREIWVPVSSIIATDGARPLAGTEIILRTNGKEEIIKSNSVGQFPPIIHNKESVEIGHRTSKNSTKIIGVISGDKGGVFSFWKNFSSWAGHSAQNKSATETISKPLPMVYVVQLGDTLGKIARKFSTTASKIRLDNNLRSDLIYPAQRLGLFGALLHNSPAGALIRARTW